MAKQLKQYTRVSDINVGDAGVARGYSGAPTMPMLTYAAEELPVRVTSDTCDMYLVAAAKDGDHQAYARAVPSTLTTNLSNGSTNHRQRRGCWALTADAIIARPE